MPRTIESIAQSQEIANRRRAEGLPVWGHTVRIKHLFTDDESDENAQRVGKEVATILRTSAWAEADREFARERGGDSEVIVCAEAFEEVQDLDDFNAVLDRLYDLADVDRAWIA